MAVRVCDAIMGSGKSSSAITYMNEHSDKRFIYITPYLEEATRIAEACKNMKFYEPQRKKEFSGSKTLHTLELVKNGENIATTHQAFRFYPQELLDEIKRQHYTLIIDENVDVLETLDIDPWDIQLAIDAGYIVKTGSNTYHLDKDIYKGETLKDLFRMLKTRDLIKVTSDKKESFYYWQLPAELITSFDDVYILTYMFEGQSLHYFLKICGIPYEYIGIKRTRGGGFAFSESIDYVPDYVSNLANMIHIIEKERLNNVGDDYYALSINWLKRDDENLARLKTDVYNFFHNICGNGADSKMWSTYADFEYKLRGKGYSNGFIPFNTKATNKFRDKVALAYCVNIFMNVGQKLFYQNNGVEVDEDKYALSIMVQWIWRSAIRDGKEVWLYIPSLRMRTLLQDWIKEVSN